MSIETEIREAFERHATDARPDSAAWSGIEKRIARSHARRVVVSGVGAALAITAVALIAPRLSSSEPEPVVPPPGPVKTVGWKTFESRIEGFRLSHPPTWSAHRDDQSDVTSVVPDDVARNGGKPIFSLSLHVDPGDYEDALIYGRKPQEFNVAPGRLPGGYSYIRVEQRHPRGNVQVWYFIDWTTPLCPAGAPCPRPSEGSVLRMSIASATPALWERYGPTVEQIAQTIRAIPPDPATTAPTVVAKISVDAFDLAVTEDAVWALQRSQVDGESGRVVRIDPASNQIIASIEVGPWPTAVAADSGAVWVANAVQDGVATPFPASNSVMRIDPRTNRVVASIRVRGPQDISVGTKGELWVTASGESDGPGITLIRIDPETNEIYNRIPLPARSGEFAHIAFGETRTGDPRPEVWVTTSGGPDRTLLNRVDPLTNTVTSTIEIMAGEGPAPLAVGLGSIWVGEGTTQTSANALTRIDPATERVVATVVLPDAAPIGITAVTTGEGYLWATGGRGSLWKVDPATNAPLGDPPVIGDDPPVGAGDLVYGLGSLWVASGDGKIWRLEP